MSRIKSAVLPALLCLGFLLVWATAVQAGSSALTKFDGGEFDLVISTDFTPTAAEQTNIESFLKITAGDLYRITEGHHSIRRFYIYTPDRDTGALRQWNKADVRFKNTADAAWAHINGFGTAGLYIWIDDNMNPISEVGHALAHEFGHYLYGLYDEYAVDRGAANEAKPGQPHKNDDPKDTIMNDHTSFFRYSVDEDYPLFERDTAQWRMHSDSIWDVLTTDPAYDSLGTFISSLLGYKPPRNDFPDLYALTEPEEVSDLTQPTGGGNPEIIWMEGSEVCIIIDHSGSMAPSGSEDKMAQAKSGAKSYLDKLKTSGSNRDWAAIVKFDDDVTTVKSLTQLTDAIKTQYKTAIDGITTDGATAIGDALRRGLNILKASTRKGTFKYIILLTDGQSNSGESPTGSVLDSLLAANIPVYCIGLGSDADMSTLNTIAAATKGKSYAAGSSATLNAIYSDIQSHVADDVLAGWERDNLNVSKNSSTTTVTVDSSANKAIFSAAYPTGETANMTLKNPNGATVVDGDPGVECENEDGYIFCEVENPMVGDWTVKITITSLAAGDKAEVVLEGKTNSDFGAQVEVTGGEYPEPIMIRAMATKDLPIAGVECTCTYVYTADNGDQGTGVVSMRDNGTPPDLVAGDGIFSGALVNYQDGQYDFNVMFDNSGGDTVTEVGDSFVSGVGDMPADKDMTRIFKVGANGSVLTSGVVADDHADLTGWPTEIEVDGDPVSGKIEVDEDVDAFYFTAQTGESYTIYTYNLYPAGMETLLTLYGSQDASDSLTSDRYSLEGNSAKIVYDNDNYYTIYLTVQHGSPGTGIYSVAVRTAQDSDRAGDEEESSSGGGCALGDGPGALLWLLVALIPALAALAPRIRRNR